ncbi:MAG: family 20 glycosylhydrolase, partial [Victivallales bacterium]|nr:family 20 glycosylhydrolase [Victivallales bacterium]
MSGKLNIFHMDFNFVCLRPEYQREWLKHIAEMGFNAILWELEDKIRWETCPECVWPEAMGKEDFKELLAYSPSLGLEPIPLLQTIGHGEYVLKHDAYREFREQPDKYDCYCTSNPNVRTFLSSWIEEYLDLFGELRYFHLGGDEAYVFATCPQCAKLADEHGRNAVYAEHIKALAKPILARSARPGIWCDMVMRHPNALDAIPKKFVIWDWNYWDEDKLPEKVLVWGKGKLSADELDNETKTAFPEIINTDGGLRAFYASFALKRMGYDVILCSATRSAGDTFLFSRLLHAGNIVGAAQVVAKENLLGNCVTNWAVRLNDFTAQTQYLGLAADALADPAKSSDELLAAACDRIFGVSSGKFVDALGKFSVSLPFAQASTTGVQWDGMKGSVSAPSGFLDSLLDKLEKETSEVLENHAASIAEGLKAIPDGIKLL